MFDVVMGKRRPRSQRARAPGCDVSLPGPVRSSLVLPATRCNTPLLTLPRTILTLDSFTRRTVTAVITWERALHSRLYFALQPRFAVHWMLKRTDCSPLRRRPLRLAPRGVAFAGAKEAEGRAAPEDRRSSRGRRSVSLWSRTTPSARYTRSEMSANGSAANEPRLCHVRKAPDFDGYGFNLHAEKGKPGQYIGKVDEGSPAEAAGLRRGDRILEVNGQSIAGETHKQVVARIKQRPDDAELLVVAPAPGEPVPDLDASPTAAPPAAADAPRQESPPPADPPRLNLQMTAAEMRAYLAAKKKFDPKKVPMDLKSKFDIVKKL